MNEMKSRNLTGRFLAFAFLAPLAWCGVAHAQAAAKPIYPAMAPVDQYLMADKAAEIAMARSAAPPSIAQDAEVMVLGRDGYSVAAKGSNGFVCIVERGWAKDTSDREYWSPKIMAPNCFNAAAADSFLKIYLMKTQLLLAGKSKEEALAATNAALDSKEIPALKTGSMAYMLSRQQFLSDQGAHPNWHPHVMFFAVGDASASVGADKPDSPIIAVNDPEERVTVFMFWEPNWSDGSPAPAHQ